MGQPIGEGLVKSMYTCVSCGICDELCYIHPGKVTEIIREMRKEIAGQGLGPPPACQQVDRNLALRRNPFGSPSKNRAKWAQGLDLRERGDTLYFAGCYTSWRHPQIGRSVAGILQTAGLRPAYLGEKEWCCGLHAYWDGQEDVALELARHNVEAVKASGAERVVFSCAECYRTFKRDYPKLLGEELPFQTLHLAELLAQLVADGAITLRKPVEQKVTYHDPCQLGRSLGVYEEPRQLLRAIPGVEVAEMERHGRFSWCCGDGCQVVSTAYPEFANWTARERLMEAREAAQVLVTACPHCYENLSLVSRKERAGVEVVDLAVMVARSLAP
ncbi:MAG TPA: (Fe-S)-binding protein [Dehalococcoidia bacterium]|nr:(Fe-S)-binding protein [Dehalococcoidia bacterium]